MSEMKVLIDALPFIKFTDRAIGNRFETALHALDVDLTDEEYVPSPPAEDAYAKLQEEITDAVEKDEEIEPVDKPVEEVIAAAELDDPVLAEDLEEITLDPDDEDDEEVK